MTPALHPEFQLAAKDTPYLLAISGGRDSVALLHLLIEHGYEHIILCHINHQLRGKDSDSDAAFVQQLANKFGLPFEIAHANISEQMSESGESMELVARSARRTHFAAFCRKHQSSKVLTAHHSDDQAETILFNLLRGSAGLKGISYRKAHVIDDTTVTFLRPLLLVSRSEVNTYIDANEIDYREDRTNAQPIAARNRIRNEVFPLLTEIMGRDVHTPINRAELVSSLNNAALEGIIENLDLYDPQGRIYLPAFKDLHPSLQIKALHIHFKKHGVSNITHSLLERCNQMLTDPHVLRSIYPKVNFSDAKSSAHLSNPQHNHESYYPASLRSEGNYRSANFRSD